MRRCFKISAGVFLGLALLWFIGFIRFTDKIFALNPDNTVNAKLYTEAMFAPHEGDFKAYQDYDKNADFDVRLIAYYLPQFHPFKENDEWHGKGFTEWTKVTAAKPLYNGHYQPKLPIDVGFYVLTHDDIMYRQIELAKNYGIQGFAFYYYWFSGKKLMEKPVYNYLNNKELDLPFCLFWANESWSRRWDGSNQEVLMPWNLTEDDFERFAEDLLPFFSDERYIKINGRPLLIIYRPQLVNRELFVKFINYLRTYFNKKGIKKPYVMGAKAEEFGGNPKDWKLDALMYFNMDMSVARLPRLPKNQISADTNYVRFDWGDYINHDGMKREYPYKTFLTVFPAWDNSARRAYLGAHIFDNATPEVYGTWLDYAIKDTLKKFSGEERIVFINAWNEWGEGAYLEPDKRYGYAYLDMTRQVLEGKYQPKVSDKAAHAGIAVLAGEETRLARGLSMLHYGKGDRLFIYGVYEPDTFRDVAEKVRIFYDKNDAGQVDLGYHAHSVRATAQELKKWVKQYDYQKIYVVVTYHQLLRSKLEFQRALPETEIEFVIAGTEHIWPRWWEHWRSFATLAAEYCKYLLVLLTTAI